VARVKDDGFIVSRIRHWRYSLLSWIAGRKEQRSRDSSGSFFAFAIGGNGLHN